MPSVGAPRMLTEYALELPPQVPHLRLRDPGLGRNRRPHRVHSRPPLLHRHLSHTAYRPKRARPHWVQPFGFGFLGSLAALTTRVPFRTEGRRFCCASVRGRDSCSRVTFGDFRLLGLEDFERFLLAVGFRVLASSRCRCARP